MNGDRIRVVYLAHAFNIGGAEEMVLNLVRRLPQRFEPLVCCINQEGAIGEEIRQTGVRFAVLGLNPGLRRPWDINLIRAYLREARPDIVHTFLLTASLYGRLAAILARVPIVIGTEVNVYERKRRHHAIVERLLMAGTDRVVASAESVRRFYVRQIHADPAKVDVIYNAVDFGQLETTCDRNETRASIGLAADVTVIGIIARLTEQKGHRVLFEALAARSLRDIHLIVVGDGELREALERDASAKGLAARVRFLGARRDLGNLLAAMDAFVMPSLWEGLPLSLVLAMGAGLPVVASNVAGIPEVVSDGRSGLLVPLGDGAALASALGRVFADRAAARSMGQAARESVLGRFGVDAYVTSIVALYDRLLARHTSAPQRLRSTAASSPNGVGGPQRQA